MLKRLLVYGFLLVTFSVKAQVNLVPNPGFEIYSECPDNTQQIIKATGWFECIGSPDYFNSCAVNPNAGIPNNRFGEQLQHSGNGYSGESTYYKKQFNAPPPYNPVLFWDGFMEIMGIRLNSKLKVGMKYNCGFYVSCADSFWYASKNIGMLFNPDSLYLPQGSGWQEKEDLTYHLIYESEPQIRYSEDAYLSDRLGWMRVDGSFIANGTEEFLYIGNFDPNADADTLMVFDSTYNVTPTQYDWNLAYYYIDDVWVFEDSTVGLSESLAPAVAIYPNPATQTVSINVPANYINPQLYIYNLTGQLVATKPIQPNQPLPITELSPGIYIFAIHSNDTLIGREKVVVY